MNDLKKPYLSRRWDDELYHHGILGQKWGVRRFQNADGSLTAAGRKRYYGEQSNKNTESIDKKALKKQQREEKRENYRKLQLNKTFNIPEEDLKNKKYADLLKDTMNAKYTPRHDTNSNAELKAFVARVALDTLVPGYQFYLPFDAYRGGKALSSHIKSKKYEKERDKSPVDPKTGFHMKTDEMKNLSEKDDLKRVNPDFNDFNSNSKSNCVLCTMTCEMRRRGYNVTANKAGIGYFDDEVKKMFKNYKTEHIESIDTHRIKQKNGEVTGSFAKSVVERIEKSQPEGARGNLSVTWGAAYGGGGHSMYYVIKNGKMVIYDGQSGKIYSNPEKILKNCSSADIGRLDNLKFDKNGIKEACR